MNQESVNKPFLIGQELGLSEAASPTLFPMNQSQYTNSKGQYDEVDLDTIVSDPSLFIHVTTNGIIVH